jgi:pimeloyl-ACP methyl ester carboxylesterase
VVGSPQIAAALRESPARPLSGRGQVGRDDRLWVGSGRFVSRWSLLIREVLDTRHMSAFFGWMLPLLEILRQDSGVASRYQLLFVHGSCSQAAMWRPMMGWFAQHGIPSAAVSLRGHGGSGGSLQGATISDYVNDVLSACCTLADRPIVLVGHSMGGFVVQHLIARIERLPLDSVVLLAPGPSRTMRIEGLRMALRRPLHFARASLSRDIRRIYDGDGLREFLLHPAIPADVEALVRSSIGPESWTALQEMNGLAPDLKADQLSTRMLVLSGSLDRMVPPKTSRATARDWGADFREVAGLSHMLAVEPGWANVAEVMMDWIAAGRLAQAS